MIYLFCGIIAFVEKTGFEPVKGTVFLHYPYSSDPFYQFAVCVSNSATSPNLAYATLDVGLYTSPFLGDSDKKLKTLKRAFTETLSYSAALLL